MRSLVKTLGKWLLILFIILLIWNILFRNNVTEDKINDIGCSIELKKFLPAKVMLIKSAGEDPVEVNYLFKSGYFNDDKKMSIVDSGTRYDGYTTFRKGKKKGENINFIYGNNSILIRYKKEKIIDEKGNVLGSNFFGIKLPIRLPKKGIMPPSVMNLSLKDYKIDECNIDVPFEEIVKMNK